MTSATYQPTPADRATVRLLTGLSAAELDDASVDGLLVLTQGAVRLAAAEALETFAGTLVSVSAESDDIKIDGSKRASALLARASSLRATHAQEVASTAGAPVGVSTTGFAPFGRSPSRYAYPVWVGNLPEQDP